MHESMSSSISQKKVELQSNSEEVTGLRQNLQQVLRENTALKQVEPVACLFRRINK